MLDIFRYQDKLCGPRLHGLDHRVDDKVGADEERAVGIIPDLRRHLEHAQNKRFAALAHAKYQGFCGIRFCDVWILGR